MRAIDGMRRLRGSWTGRLRTLPILALHVHGSCNCRCVMCDIWRANLARRELSEETLAGHLDAMGRLSVSRVMLTGGEPLLHSNLWRLCDRLSRAGVRVTLVTTGLALASHADDISRAVDTVIVSLDGPPGVHDTIRGVRHGVTRIAAGVAALRRTGHPPSMVARTVVQRANFNHLSETIATARRAGFDRISFLAVDVDSTAFNRDEPWPAGRRADVAIPASDLPALARAIRIATEQQAELFRSGFVEHGAAGLERIHAYSAALAGLRRFPAVRCNAPWVSAVIELDGRVRPCFFHPAYEATSGDLESTLNQPSAVRFRRELDPRRDPVCRRCVCSLHLPLYRSP